MIRIPCGQCGAKLQVKEDLAGKRVKCPHCKQVADDADGAVAPAFTRPEPAAARRSAVAEDADQRTDNQIAGAKWVKVGGSPSDNAAGPRWPLGFRLPPRFLRVLGALCVSAFHDAMATTDVRLHDHYHRLAATWYHERAGVSDERHHQSGNRLAVAISRLAARSV